MATGLASFFVDIGIHGDTLTLKDMVNKMADLKIESLAQLEVLDRLKGSFKDVFSEALRHGTQLESMNDIFGLDPETVQAWERVAYIMGGMASDADSTMEGVQTVLSKRATPEASARFYAGAANLGLGDISGIHKAGDLMAVLLSKVPSFIEKQIRAGVTPEDAKGHAKMWLGDYMGINNGTIVRILEAGMGNFKEKAGAYGGMSNADVKRWALLNEEMNILIGKWKFFILQFEESALPGILKFGGEVLKDAKDIKNGKISKTRLFEDFAGGAAGFGLTTSALGWAGAAMAAPFSGGFTLLAAGVSSLGAAMAVNAALRRDDEQRSITHNVNLDVHGGDAHTLRATAKQLSEYMLSDFSDFVQAKHTSTAKRVLLGEGF